MTKKLAIAFLAGVALEGKAHRTQHGEFCGGCDQRHRPQPFRRMLLLERPRLVSERLEVRMGIGNPLADLLGIAILCSSKRNNRTRIIHCSPSA